MDSHSLHALVAHRHRVSLVHGIWRLAEPKATMLAAVPFCLGLAIAWSQKKAAPLLVIFGALAALYLIEIAKNAINDFADFRSGADLAVRPEDRSPLSGGKRVLVDNLLSEGEVLAIAWVALLTAGLFGVAVALRTNLSLLGLGVVGAFIAAQYSLRPFRLSYRGYGELAVLLVYGPAIVFGAILLSGGAITLDAVFASLILGTLIANSVVMNEIPDMDADRFAERKTLVVLAGRERAKSIIEGVYLCTFLVTIASPFFGASFAVVGLLAAAPVADSAVMLMRERKSGPPIGAQSAAVLAYVVAAATASLLFVGLR